MGVKNRVLQSLFRLTTLLGRTLDLLIEARVFMTWLVEEVKPKHAALFIVDEKKKEFLLVHSCGFKLEGDLSFPIGFDIWRWLEEKGNTILKEGDPRRYIVPMMIEAQLIGAICIISSHRSVESIREEQILLETASGCLAPVIRNIWRYSLLEKQVEERTALLGEAKRKLEAEVGARIALEEKLLEERNLLRSLIDSVPDFIYVKDRDGRFLVGNNAVTHLMGLENPEQLIGKTDFDFYPEELAKRYFDDEQEIVRTGKPIIDREEPLLDLSLGREGWILTTKVPLKDREGRVVGIVGIGRDITKLKEYENELIEDKLFIEAIMATAPVLIVLTDPDGRIVLFNKACERLTGYTSEEVKGKSISELFLPEDWVLVVQKRFINPYDPELLKPHQNPWITKSGEERLIEWRCAPVELSGYAKPCVLGIGLDITEHKKLEEQFLQAQKMEAIGRLAGGVAHDFNNMLTAILGYAQLAIEKLDSENPIHGYIKEIGQAGERAASLTRQLLAFSRKQILQPQVLNLNTLVTNLEKMIRRLVGEDIELIIILNPEIGCVRADPAQLEQVIMNLVVNARDAMPGGGKIAIETLNVYLDEKYAESHVGVKPGDYVMLAVSDTGVGMNREVLSHIFEPFFTTKEMGKGTGLGLSTVYGIVKQSGGNIWVYSEPGKGASFKIYLPMVGEVAEPVKKDEGGVKDIRGTETVLIVEDDDQVREIARWSLNYYGYNVIVANRPEEALDISSEFKGFIHITVTDVVMPGMSGQELVAKLRIQRPEMRVLYMSGYTDNTIVHYGILERGVPFIQKPFSPENFVGKVREVLDSEVPYS
jgi:PAS domain S-box-containing protein